MNALKLANSLPNSVYNDDVKRSLRSTISKVEIASKKMIDRKTSENTQYKDWWGNIVAGTAKLAEAGNSTAIQKDALNAIDQLIQAEQEKITAIKEKELKNQLFNE